MMIECSISAHGAPVFLLEDNGGLQEERQGFEANSTK